MLNISFFLPDPLPSLDQWLKVQANHIEKEVENGVHVSHLNNAASESSVDNFAARLETANQGRNWEAKIVMEGVTRHPK